MKNLHLEKFGLAGSLFALMCCLGFGPLIAIVSAVGAGFIINDAILAPLLFFFLLLGAVGLVITRRRHRRWSPLAVHLASATAVVIFTFVLYVPAMIWIGVLGLLAAIFLDFMLGERAVRPGP
ncbi:MerC domain-containing protein [Desulfoferrobacter suflitae]|jgi:mercuric ion transport protein|uniref:MerC domain-containing protein n=1 Tax=Desulfoferrobacter suflitae TaxID=2865782 RepID=UPI0021647C5C|nr:MerC domain-containing protein [Desulfoferrobacter suflitae]MCK8604201.1 MerC domain-containing protein [Desulfoferrobacter suflitae]MDD3815872.1 MerC domain-containing protein [Desulfocapsaceae bacterium]